MGTKNDEEDLKIIKEAIKNAPPITLAIEPLPAFALLGLIQLVCTHPGLPAGQKQLAEKLGRRIQEAVAKATSSQAMNEIMEKGWRREFDVKYAICANCNSSLPKDEANEINGFSFCAPCSAELSQGESL